MPPRSQALRELMGLTNLPVWGWILPRNSTMVSKHSGLPFDHANPDSRHPALVIRDWDPRPADYCWVYPRSTKHYNRRLPESVKSLAHPDGHEAGCCINEIGWVLRDIHLVAAAGVVEAADEITGWAYRCTEPDASGLRAAIELPVPAF